MQDEQQFEQLMLQYNQLKNGSEDIKRMIESEDFDSAITMLKNREQIFMNCKCMRKFLELTPVQTKELDKVLDELRALEIENIKNLTKSKVDPKLCTIQRSKGLGENEPEMMWKTTMNPKSRRLIKACPEDAMRTAEVFDLLLGDNLAGRKLHIEMDGKKYLDMLDLG